MQSKLLYIVFLILVVFSCKNEKQEEHKVTDDNIPNKTKMTKTENLNISFLLDLSDRINPQKYSNATMEFYMRDISYIKSVSDAFLAHLEKKKVRNMNDKIQLYFDPEPKNQSINLLSDSLKYHINKSNASLEVLEEIKNAYHNKPKSIYEAAIEDNTYIGSDTWRFFKNKVNDFCISKEHRNILIILTDGYIYHKNTLIKENKATSYLTPQLIRQHKLNTKDWKKKMERENFGFIAATENIENLEILVLGINPDTKNPYEEDVILKYWSDWFDRMNVKKYEIKTAILPSNMDKIIREFILNKSIS